MSCANAGTAARDRAVTHVPTSAGAGRSPSPVMQSGPNRMRSRRRFGHPMRRVRCRSTSPSQAGRSPEHVTQGHRLTGRGFINDPSLCLQAATATPPHRDGAARRASSAHCTRETSEERKGLSQTAHVNSRCATCPRPSSRPVPWARWRPQAWWRCRSRCHRESSRRTA